MFSGGAMMADDDMEPGTEDGCPDETVIFPKREEQ